MAYQQPRPPPGYAPQPQGYGQPAPYTLPEYANWLYRVASYLIDAVVTSVPIIIGSIVAGIANAGQQPGSSSGGGAAVLVVAYLVSLVILVWNSFIRQGNTGQSLGKQAVGTRLVSATTGQPIGALMAFVRQICHFLDALPCYLGYLWPLWDARRQTFADKIVGTVVVRA